MISEAHHATRLGLPAVLWAASMQLIEEYDVLDTLLQDRMFAAATLMLLHLAAFFQADDIIMREIPGSHPYLTGIGILGGMYSFANPLQGTVTNHFVLQIVGAVAAAQLRLPNLWVCADKQHCTCY